MRARAAAVEVHAPLNPRGLIPLVLIALLILGPVVFAVWQEHRHAIDRAELKVEQLTRMLALEVDDLFSDIDELQQALARLLPTPDEELVSDPAVEDWLRAFADSITGLDGLNIFDAAGELRHSSFAGLESLSITDRWHFQILREEPEREVVFTELLTARSTGRPSLLQLRALRDERGRFVGVVTAVIGLERLSDLLLVANVDPSGVALLRRSDTSSLIARYPRYSEADFNRPLPRDNPIRERLLSGEHAGALRYTASTDGVKRVGSFQTIEDYPFYVQVAVSEEYALAGWWRRVGLLSGLATLLMAGSLLFLGRLQRAQQRAEANARALADSERHARALIRALPDTLFRIDADGTFLDCEVGGEAHLLMSPEAFLGKTLHSLFPIELADGALAAIREALSSGEVARYEYSTHTLGRPGHFEARVVPLAERQVLMIVRDVSERHALEVEQAAAHRFRENLLASLGEGVFGIDTEGRYTFLNPMACRLLGFSDEAPALGLDSHESSHHTHPDGSHYPADECPIYGVLHSGVAIEAWEDTFWSRDGQSFPVLVYAAPVHDNDGGIAGAVVSFQDISQRRASEEELRRSNAELEQFAYAISHDMRQPLRMVNSYLQLLERSLGASLDDDQRRFFGYATDGARRMDAMIIGLLEYSRVGRKTEPMAPLDTSEALDIALAFLRPAVEESGGEVDIEGEWPELLASRDEMVRLFQNLVGNALKYVPADTRPAITVTSRTTPNDWLVRIADNGVGVDPLQKDRLFQVFSRLHTREQYEGSGIGLALCRRIVEHHEGSIGVESEGPGCGSTFWFRIPRLQQGEKENV